jgi:hypothetical protein
MNRDKPNNLTKQVSHDLAVSLIIKSVLSLQRGKQIDTVYFLMRLIEGQRDRVIPNCHC